MQNKDSESEKPKLCSLAQLFQFLQGSDRCLLFIGALAGTFGGLSMPAFVFFFGKLTDSFDPAAEGQDTLDQIAKLSKIYLIIGSVLWVLGFIFFSFWRIIAEKIGYEFKYRYLKAILNQEAAWYDGNDPLELPTKISNECAKIQEATGEKFVMILNSLATCLGGFIIAFSIGWKYSFAALGIFPIMIGAIAVITNGIKIGYAKSASSYAKSSSFAEQALNNIKVVSAFGQEKREIGNYVKHLDEAKSKGKVGKAIIGLSFGVFDFLIFTSYAYGLFVGGQFVNAEIWNHNRGRNYTSGDIISIFFGILIGITASGASSPNIKVVTEGRIAAYNALQVIHRQPKILIDDLSAIKVPRISSDICFQNVSFKYSTREEKALDNISCTIQKGKTTAFVGPSGSGKSTIVKILERFYDPDQGKVLVNGHDLKQLNLRQFRQKVGYVGQEPVLFNESIKDNMLNAKPDATEDEIIHALKQANAMAFINRLSEGIKTNAGASGGQLSGGEKQRIALARAFLKQPDLLILDEATSALDRKNETEVQKAIENINRETDITTVVIAHRLSTIRKADKIIVIDKGQIKEEGNHDTLLEDYPDGIYAKLVNTQQSSSSEVFAINEGSSSDSIMNKISNSLSKLKPQQKELVHIEQEITKDADIEKEKLENKIKQIREQRKKKGFFKRLCVHNKPVKFLVLGIISSMIASTIYPVFAIFWTRILFIMMDQENMGNQLIKY